MKTPRPGSIVVIQFANGALTVRSAKTKDELRALMKGDTDGNITLKGLDKQLVVDTKTKEPEYLMDGEETTFHKSLMVFYTLFDVVDAPKIDTTMGGLIDPSGRKI